LRAAGRLGSPGAPRGFLVSHAAFSGDGRNCRIVFFYAKKTIYGMAGGRRMAAADELIRQLRAIEDLRPSKPTAQESRRLAEAFLKVENQSARRVIIDLVEQLATRPRPQD
jgi:hypothetical protein